MIDRSDKPTARPSDVRSISDPPDMGRLKPAEEVAKEFARASGVHALIQGHASVMAFKCATEEDAATAAGGIADALAELVAQSRAEGAAAALEEAADALDAAANRALDGKALDDPFAQGKAKGYDGAAQILRARAKGISDPPDMG